MQELKAVIGASMGDEGKGLVTHNLCQRAIEQNKSCLVVLTNGGAQRGHTVELPDGKRYIFHHFGSGTAAGADTLCSKTFILNPMTFVKELSGLGLAPRVYVDPRCKYTTPWDMMVNQIVETARGDERHGSCGMGIWETIARYASYANSFVELVSMPREAQFAYLKTMRDVYFKRHLLCMYSIKKIPDRWAEAWYSDGLINHFLDDVMVMAANVAFELEENVVDRYDTVVCENGQGLLLDSRLEGFYGDNVTPTRTGACNALRFASKAQDVELCYVTRSYMTRHGAGLFYTENKEVLTDETNVTNEFQGKLRFGELIVPSLMVRIDQDSAIIKDARVSVAVTHLNEKQIDLDMLAKYKVYTSDNKFTIS